MYHLTNYMSTKSKIEKLRSKLHDNIKKYGINSKQTKIISMQLDELINEYNKSQQIFDEYNNMKIAYKESLNKIRKIAEEFGEFPSIKEWNKYANEKMLLSSESIKFISHLNWNQLREKVLYEINKKIF